MRLSKACIFEGYSSSTHLSGCRVFAAVAASLLAVNQRTVVVELDLEVTRGTFVLDFCDFNVAAEFTSEGVRQCIGVTPVPVHYANQDPLLSLL